MSNVYKIYKNINEYANIYDDLVDYAHIYINTI